MKHVAALFLTMGLLHPVESLTAATASVTFTGYIEQVRGYGTPIWYSSVTVGAPYVATFRYDTSAPDLNPANNGGYYRLMGPSAVTYSFGNYSFSRDMSYVSIADNDPLFGDGFQFQALGGSANSLGLSILSMVQNCYLAPASALSSDSVDNVALLPGIFSTCADQHALFRATYDGDNGFTGIDFMAQSVVVVPEPSAATLAILGFVAAAAARYAAKRKRKYAHKPSAEFMLD